MFHNFASKHIYQSQLDLSICNEAYKFVDKMKDNFTDKSWECKIRTSLNYQNNIINNLSLHKLKMNVLSHIDIYMHESKNFYEGFISSSWINIYEKDFYQEYHIHNSNVHNFISGVLYLSKINSDIIFASDTSMNNIIKITPNYGDIVLFLGDTPHRVEPNQNNDLRISLAFNFKICDVWRN